MPNPIPPEEAARLGVRTLHETMDNGERRFRLCFADGTSYIRTEAPEIPHWENSHRHDSTFELGVVQAGALLYVELGEDGTLTTRVFHKGETVLTGLNVRHNACFSKGCVVHTVKFGDIKPGDWHACPELDEICRRLDPEVLPGGTEFDLE